MTADEIRQYLTELNEELRLMDIKGEVSLYGGAVMCLAYDARASTKDVDAIFKPTSEIRLAVKRIAERHDLRDDWMNDAVKGYWAEHERRVLFSMSNLTVLVPEPDYLLAMKSLAARDGTLDREDVLTLIEMLGIKSADEVLQIVENYYPRHQIKPATQYFIEALFEE